MTKTDTQLSNDIRTVDINKKKLAEGKNFNNLRATTYTTNAEM